MNTLTLITDICCWFTFGVCVTYGLHDLIKWCIKKHAESVQKKKDEKVMADFARMYKEYFEQKEVERKQAELNK